MVTVPCVVAEELSTSLIKGARLRRFARSAEERAELANGNLTTVAWILVFASSKAICPGEKRPKSTARTPGTNMARERKSFSHLAEGWPSIRRMPSFTERVTPGGG